MPQAVAATPTGNRREEFKATHIEAKKVTGMHAWGAQRTIDARDGGVTVYFTDRFDNAIQMNVAVGGPVNQPGFVGRTGYAFFHHTALFEPTQLPLRDGARGPGGASYDHGKLELEDSTEFTGARARFIPDWMRAWGQRLAPLNQAITYYENWLAPQIGAMVPYQGRDVTKVDASVSPDLHEVRKLHVTQYREVAGHAPELLTDVTMDLEPDAAKSAAV